MNIVGAIDAAKDKIGKDLGLARKLGIYVTDYADSVLSTAKADITIRTTILMGNSILDYNVFARIAGIYAAKGTKKVTMGKLTLNHLVKYERMLEEAGIKTERKSPMVLPYYKAERVILYTIEIFLKTYKKVIWSMKKWSTI